jgi:hypothetical protein
MMEKDTLVGWLTLLAVWIVTTIILSILQKKKKIDFELFYIVFPGVNSACLLLFILCALFDNN